MTFSTELLPKLNPMAGRDVVAHDDVIVDMFAANPWATVVLIAVVVFGVAVLLWVAR